MNFSRLSIEYEIINNFSVKELSDICSNLGMDSKFKSNQKLEAINCILEKIGSETDILIFNLNNEHIKKIINLIKLDSKPTRYENQSMLVEYLRKLKMNRLGEPELIGNHIDQTSVDNLISTFEMVIKTKRIRAYTRELAVEVLEVIQRIYNSNPHNNYKAYLNKYVQGQKFGNEILIEPEQICSYLTGLGNSTIAAVNGTPNWGFSKMNFFVNKYGEKSPRPFCFEYFSDAMIIKVSNW